MTCANCGTPQKDNEEICLACGAKYPEINSKNKPASKSAKSREVGASSGVFSIFDSENDVTNKRLVDEDNLYDVLTNKVTSKKETVVEESLIEKPVIEELVVEEPIIEEPVTEEVVVEEPIIEEPVTEEVVIEEPIIEEPVTEEVVIEEPIIEEPVTEEIVIEESIIEEPVTEEPVIEELVVEESIMEEPVIEESIIEGPTTVEAMLDSFISESDIDTENNVFKDSDSFNISLSDLDELEKAIAKDKVETFDMDLEIDDVDVFESFDDILKNLEAANIDLNSEEIVNNNDFNNSTSDNLEVFGKSISDDEPVQNEDDIEDELENLDLDAIFNELDEMAKSIDGLDELENVEITEAISEEKIEDLNLDGISFDGIDLGELNLDELNLELDNYIETSSENNDRTDYDTVSDEDFIKLDGVDDIISELEVEDFDDVDEFLEKNKFIEDVEFEVSPVENFNDDEFEEEFNIDDVEIEEINKEDFVLKQSGLDKTTNSSVGKAENDIFDISLDELDNLEKMLIAENEKSSFSDIEQALLSGEVVIEQPSYKEANVEETDIFNDTEETIEDSTEVLDNIESILRENVSEDTENTQNTEPSESDLEAKFNQVTKALQLRAKGEEVDFLQKNKRDFDIDEAKINEIVATVKRLKTEIDSYNDEYEEDLLNLEEDILKHARDIEKHEKMSQAEHVDSIDDIDDLDFDNFVDEEEITDSDNILKSDVDEDIQSAIDEVIQKAKERVESVIEETEELVKAEDVDLGNIETEETKTDVQETESETKPETKKELLDDIDAVESEILAKASTENSNQTNNANETVETVDIDSLLSEVIGSFEQVKPKEEPPKVEFKPVEEDVQEFVQNTEVLHGVKYDPELVREYEALRLDLEFFFPSTQEVEKLDKDIEKLLANGEVEEIANQMEHDILLGELGDFDFDELSDKDISDALLEIREMKDKEDIARRRREERQKKLKKRQAMFVKFYTYGGIFKKIDATIVHAVIITCIIVGFAGYSTYKTESLSVNMLSRSEKVEITEQLWVGLIDNAESFVNLQKTTQDYVEGNISQEEMIDKLDSYIDENVMARSKFETIDIPTYSEFKYKIDKFLADRMLAADKALKDVTEGKTNSPAIQELIKLKTDVKSLEESKNDFYKQMGI